MPPPTKQLAREVFLRTLGSINIPAVVTQKVELGPGRVVLPGGTVDIPAGARFLIVAIGKAAHAMAAGLVALFPPGTRLRGIISAPTPPAQPLAGFEYFVGGHPTPNQDSWRSAEAILQLLATCDTRTVVFFLLSGGGSALVERPLDPWMTLD